MRSTSRLQAERFQSIVDNDRRHGLVLDLPEAKGGDDFAPTALELAVVTVDSDEPEEKLQRVLQKTMQVCPVGRLYEKAGIEIGTQLIRAQELAASAN